MWLKVLCSLKLVEICIFMSLLMRHENGSLFLIKKKTCLVPIDAPLRLNLGDGGIFHIFKAQVFLEMSLVYAHRHGYISIAVQRSMSPAGEPLTAPPEVMTAWWKTSHFLLTVSISLGVSYRLLNNSKTNNQTFWKLNAFLSIREQFIDWSSITQLAFSVIQTITKCYFY